MLRRVVYFCGFSLAAVVFSNQSAMCDDVAAQKSYTCEHISAQAVAETLGFEKSLSALESDDDGSCEIFFDKQGLSTIKIQFVRYPTAASVVDELQSMIKFPTGEKIEIVPNLGELAIMASLDDLSISKSSTMPGHPKQGELKHGESRTLNIAAGNTQISLAYGGVVIPKTDEAVKATLIELGRTLL